MSRVSYRVVTDSRFHYKRLEPVPPTSELEAFYQNEYFDFVRNGERAPDMRRLADGGAAGNRERQWLEATLWMDLVDLLRQHAFESVPRPRLVDVGCGTGHFANFLQRNTDWDVVGIEPNLEAADQAASKGVQVYSSIRSCRVHNQTFQAAILLNVLEHVGEPVRFLGEIHSLLAEGALLLVMVPNDFSEIQEAVRAQAGKEPWWVAIPDHVNYFDFNSLSNVLEAAGFQVLDRTTTFPMELFLAFGVDYVGNAEVGAWCHEKRVQFELTLPTQLRRDLYRSLAERGIGRHAIILARRVSR